MSDYWAEPGNQTQESAAQDVGADNMPGWWPGSWKPEWETQILEMIKLITWSVEWDNDPEIWNLPEIGSYWSEDPGGNTRACHWTTWVTRQCTLLTQTRGMIRGTKSVRTDQGSSQHQEKKKTKPNLEGWTNQQWQVNIIIADDCVCMISRLVWWL